MGICNKRLQVMVPKGLKATLRWKATSGHVVTKVAEFSSQHPYDAWNTWDWDGNDFQRVRSCCMLQNICFTYSHRRRRRNSTCWKGWVLNGLEQRTLATETKGKCGTSLQLSATLGGSVRVT